MLNHADIARQVAARLNDKYWATRATEMIAHVCTSNTVPLTATLNRVAKDWPLKGSITFTRDQDGQRFRAYLTRRKFKVVAAS